MTTSVIGKPLPRVDGRAKVTGRRALCGRLQPAGPGLCGDRRRDRRSRPRHRDRRRSRAADARRHRGHQPSQRAAPRLSAAQGLHRSGRRRAAARAAGRSGALLRPARRGRGGRYARPGRARRRRARGRLCGRTADGRSARSGSGHRPGSRDPAGATSTADTSRGDADGALRDAAVKVEPTYDIARENHNPMEPHATVAAWDGDRLTLWSKSQFVVNEQAEIAAIFGLPAENVQVICPFIGGAFGTSLRTWPHVTLAALAARQVGRPVKLVLTPQQMFYTTGTARAPCSVSRSAPRPTASSPPGPRGHRRDQPLRAVHRGADHRRELHVLLPERAHPYRLLPLDIGTPNHMRGPGEASGIFALECAMDELAYALGIDPIELRRRNEPEIDEGENRPFSSRSLMKCYELGAERFGWSRRDPRAALDARRPPADRHGHGRGDLSGFTAPASARVRLLPDGMAEVEAAASDMGPGTYTSMTQVAADVLGCRSSRCVSARPLGFPARAAARRLDDHGVGRFGDPRRLPGGAAEAARRAVATSARRSSVPRSTASNGTTAGCAAAAKLAGPDLSRHLASDGKPIEAALRPARSRDRPALLDARFRRGVRRGRDRSRCRHDQRAARGRCLRRGPHRQSAPRQRASAPAA